MGLHCLGSVRIDTGLANQCVGLLDVVDAAALCAEIPRFAPSGDSLFFEVRKEK